MGEECGGVRRGERLLGISRLRPLMSRLDPGSELSGPSPAASSRAVAHARCRRRRRPGSRACATASRSRVWRNRKAWPSSSTRSTWWAHRLGTGPVDLELGQVADAREQGMVGVVVDDWRRPLRHARVASPSPSSRVPIRPRTDSGTGPVPSRPPRTSSSVQNGLPSPSRRTRSSTGEATGPAASWWIWSTQLCAGQRTQRQPGHLRVSDGLGDELLQIIRPGLAASEPSSSRGAAPDRPPGSGS